MDMQQVKRLWLNAFNREMIESGELKQWIDDGIFSEFSADPTVLERAIGEGTAYDDPICDSAGPDPNLIFDQLLTEDAQRAADLLRPLYDATNGDAGYVAVDVSPLIGNNSNTGVAQVAEARRLFKAVNRPNALVKIIGSQTNLTTIEEALFVGVNVNVTLVYSAQQYLSAAESYVRALERRLYAGLPVAHVTSAVSFAVDTVDVFMDKHLENSIRAAQSRGDIQRVTEYSQLIGKTGVANALNAYKIFRDLFYGERFARLRDAGAKVQHLVFVNTQPPGAHSPLALYMEKLLLPDTRLMVNKGALTELTAQSSDESSPEITSATDLLPALHEANLISVRLSELSIEFERIARQLQGDADEAFTEAYKKLIARVDGKRNLLTSGFMRRQHLVLGMYQRAVEAELKRLRRQLSITRTWAHDPTLWSESPDDAAIITNRLGWLTVATDGRVDRTRLQALRDESHAMDWKHVVLLGMGGSSLPADVLYKTLGQQAGYPVLIVLDSTVPAAIQFVQSQIDLDSTVFIVASKSGTTLETLSLYRYFFAQYAPAEAGKHFIAITDPGSPLEIEAQASAFRHIFLNPTDIGGHYSALSYFGMTPAAICGLEFERIMDAGAEMQTASGNNVMGNNHPGLWLGTVMGVLAGQERDKLTIITSSEIATLGNWAEHLIGESMGQDGRGILPVVGPTVGMPHDYDDDRLLVYVRLDESPDNPDEAVQSLQESGQPLVTLELRNRFDIGAEFFRWQFAVATAGMILGINPFNDPTVLEGKINTNRLLENYKQHGTLAIPEPTLTENGVSLYTDDATAALLEDLRVQHAYNATALPGMLAAFFSLARSGRYLALLAYLHDTPEVTDSLQNARRRMRHVFHRAVTLGIGPRYLHSTGQLHKDGSNNGLFVIISAADDVDLPIPDAGYGFSIIKQAQMIGDYEALRAKGRRVVRLHLGRDVVGGLKTIHIAIEAAAEKRK